MADDGTLLLAKKPLSIALQHAFTISVDQLVGTMQHVGADHGL